MTVLVQNVLPVVLAVVLPLAWGLFAEWLFDRVLRLIWVRTHEAEAGS